MPKLSKLPKMPKNKAYYTPEIAEIHKISGPQFKPIGTAPDYNPHCKPNPQCLYLEIRI